MTFLLVAFILTVWKNMTPKQPGTYPVRLPVPPHPHAGRWPLPREPAGRERLRGGVKREIGLKAGRVEALGPRRAIMAIAGRPSRQRRCAIKGRLRIK
jgi:hypothetical protein